MRISFIIRQDDFLRIPEIYDAAKFLSQTRLHHRKRIEKTVVKNDVEKKEKDWLPVITKISNIPSHYLKDAIKDTEEQAEEYEIVEGVAKLMRALFVNNNSVIGKCNFDQCELKFSIDELKMLVAHNVISIDGASLISEGVGYCETYERDLGTGVNRILYNICEWFEHRQAILEPNQYNINIELYDGHKRTPILILDFFDNLLHDYRPYDWNVNTKQKLDIIFPFGNNILFPAFPQIIDKKQSKKTLNKKEKERIWKRALKEAGIRPREQKTIEPEKARMLFKSILEKFIDNKYQYDLPKNVAKYLKTLEELSE